MRQLVLGVLLAASLARGAAAQELRHVPGPAASVLPPPVQKDAPSVAGPLVGGFLGGALGFVAGAFAGGSAAEGSCNNEDLGCLLGGILIGAAIGEAMLLPVGAHLGGGRRGSFGRELLASVGIAAAGVALTAATAEPAVLIPVPLLQLWAVTALERRAGER